MSENNNEADVTVNRRNLMKAGAATGAAATVGTTAGVASLSDPVSAQSSMPTLTSPIMRAKALTEIMVSGLDSLGVEGFDFGSNNEQAKEKWSRMFTQAEEIGAKDEIVNTIISNSYDEFRNAYFIEGKREAIKAMNNGDSKSSVKTQAVDFADKEHAAVMQRNLLKYWDVRNQEIIRFSKAGKYIKNNYTEDNVNKLFSVTMDGGVNGSFSKNLTSIATESQMFDKSFTLFDGSTYTFTGENRQVDQFGNVFLTLGPYDHTLTENTNKGSVPSGNPWSIPDIETTDRDQQIDKIYVYDIPGPEGDGNALLFDLEKWHKAYWYLGKYRNDAASELKTWIDGVYSGYSAGEITAKELVNAYDLSDMSTEGEYSAGTVSLFKLGIATDPGTEMEIELNDGTTLTGSLFIDDKATLKTGQIYSPSEFNGSVYATFVPDSSGSAGVREIQQKFKITSATDSEGNSLDSVAFDGANDVETSDTDVQSLKDELSKLRDRNEKLQEQVDSLGGGGGSGDGILDAFGETDPLLLVAGAAGGLALINALTS